MVLELVFLGFLSLIDGLLPSYDEEAVEEEDGDESEVNVDDDNWLFVLESSVFLAPFADCGACLGSVALAGKTDQQLFNPKSASYLSLIHI